MNMSVRPRFADHYRAPARSPDAIKDALFQPMGVDGVYARTGLYETVVERLASFVTRHREAGTEVFRFPPVMSRRDLERHGYLKSFPNLLGCVCALHGTDAEITAAADRHEKGGDWTASLSPADLVLSPAASPRWWPGAVPCPAAAPCSTWRPTASATSPRPISTGCNPSGCGNTCAWVRKPT